MLNNINFIDDDANYDENDAAWQEEETDELSENGFKGEDEEVEEEEKKVVADDEDEDEEEDDLEGFGLEKDV